MAGLQLAVLLFGLAVTSALPQPDQKINIEWPNQPDWWPDLLPWPLLPEHWPDWWPEVWPPTVPEQWPEKPTWWPDSAAWPPERPQEWPDRPSLWPEHLPWPPQLPEDRPDFWPEILPWPPGLPEDWPDKPDFWPEHLPWPPALPDQWPAAPDFWPDILPWPPALPDFEWPPPGVNPDLLPYVPSRDNEFHLFTRANPTMSQPLVYGNYGLLRNSNYEAGKPLAVLVHGEMGSPIHSFNTVLVPAFLAAGDINVLVIDWSDGAWENPALTTVYSVASGNFVATFLNWLLTITDSDFNNVNLVGHSLGGLNVGFIGLRMNRRIGMITSLAPSQGHELTRFLPPFPVNAGGQVEVTHVDIGNSGYAQPLGHRDFYPNGGGDQPGCGGNSVCNRNRAFYFFGESLRHPGSFTSKRCTNWRDALTGNCHGPETSNLGGLLPKDGPRGVFYLSTNALPPFSRG